MKSRTSSPKKTKRAGSSKRTGRTKDNEPNTPSHTPPLEKAQTATAPEGKGDEAFTRTLAAQPGHGATHGADIPLSTRSLICTNTDVQVAFHRALNEHADALYEFERTNISDTRELRRKSEDLCRTRNTLIVARDRMLRLNRAGV